MPFERILNQLVDELEGASGAVFVDWEGETVLYRLAVKTENGDDAYNLKVLGAHYGILLDRFQKTTGRFALGNVEYCETIADGGVVFAGRASSEYALVLQLNSDADLTRARRAMQHAIEELARALK